MEKRLLHGLVIVVSKEGEKNQVFQIVEVSVRAECGSLVKWEESAWSKETYTMVYRGDIPLLGGNGTPSEVHVRVFSRKDQERLRLPPGFFVFPARPINPCLVVDRMHAHIREINTELHKMTELYPALKKQLTQHEQKQVQEFCSIFGGNLSLIQQQISALENISAIQEKE